MIEQSISGICIMDANQRFVYVNPRLTVILGYESSESIIGRPALDFVAAENHALVAENMRLRVVGEAQSERYNFEAIRKDGSRITLGAHGTTGLYDGKRVVIATVQDVTELRRAEEEIERTVAKLRRAVQSTIEVVSTIGEMRDPYTHGHEHRVGEIATAIAIEMGLPADRIEGIRVAGYLHDVGKIAVPAEILSKPMRLSKTEYELVKQHAQQSYEILKGVEFPWPVAEAAWQHHERLDGSGYPRGLKGDGIILEARILAVADTVEAMASHRPYRPGLGLEAALAEIETNRGRLYDPMIVDACLRLFRLKGYQLPA
jgi:PAS domain S-box-containing protein/putative nucleotidyltransferase with HDIG domain